MQATSALAGIKLRQNHDLTEKTWMLRMRSANSVAVTQQLHDCERCVSGRG